MNIAQVPVSGIWRRHTVRHADSVSLAPPEFDGRWQRGRVVRAMYLADGEPTMWSEFYRAAAELEAPPGRLFPRLSWRLEVELEGVADLSSAEALAAAGLPWPEPTSEQWPLFQDVGEQLAAEGASGIVFPTSARAAGVCLCVFEPAVAAVRAAGEPRLVREPPAPPRGLRT